MKVLIIGSTQYKERMEKYVEKLEKEGHVVALPAFDDHPKFDTLDVCKYNLSLIEQADEIHMFWNGRSWGCWGDFCMAFALRKPIRLIYLEPKSIREVVEKYCQESESGHVSS